VFSAKQYERIQLHTDGRGAIVMRMIGPFGRFSGVRRQRRKNKGYCTIPAGLPSLRQDGAVRRDLTDWGLCDLRHASQRLICQSGIVCLKDV
jgi:hypothetical protein